MGSLPLAAAHAELIVNGSFETGDPPLATATALPVGTAFIPGWVVVAHDGTTTGTGAPIHNLFATPAANSLGTPYGSSFLDLSAPPGDTGPSGVSTSFATTSGQAYRVTFSIADGTGIYAGPISVGVTVGGVGTTVTKASQDGIAAGIARWAQESLDFTATDATTTLTIVGNSGFFIGLDDVAVEAVTDVAEPASASLLALGAFGALTRRRASRARRAGLRLG